MIEDRISEILKQAKEKEERPTKEFRPSRLQVLKNFLNQFKATSRLTYVAEKIDESGIDSRVVSYYAPDSPASEQYRMLRTHLFAIKPGNALKTILVTSAHRQEGKTLTAINLAITLAQDANKKILLLDADLRRGEIKKILNLHREEGLAEVLAGKVEIDGVIQNTRIPGLSAIASGSKPLNPSELLGLPRMKEILNGLKKRYDQVLLDVPPVIPVTDAAVLVPTVDGIILVIKAESTRLEVIEHAQFLIQQAKGKILGYVLTSVEYHIPEYIHKYL